MFWMRAYPLRGEVGGGWALEFSSFLGPLKGDKCFRVCIVNKSMVLSTLFIPLVSSAACIYEEK